MNLPINADLKEPVPGLVLVAATNPAVLHQARFAITQEILNHGQNIGLELSVYGKAVSLFSGPAHQQKRFALSHAQLARKLEGQQLDIRVVSSRTAFDYCCDESSAVLLPIFAEAAGGAKPTAFILAQTATDAPTLLRADTLGTYRRALAEAGATGFVFLVVKNKSEIEELAQLCDEFIEVHEAEPDADMDAALIVNVHSLQGFNRFNCGKIMCGIRYTDQETEYRFSPFISIYGEDRLMWALRCKDRSFAEIGKLVGPYTKSTVLRRLSNLPRPVKQDIDEAWLEQMLERYGVEDEDEEGDSSGPAQRSDDDNEDSDLDDLDEEDYDES